MMKKALIVSCVLFFIVYVLRSGTCMTIQKDAPPTEAATAATTSERPDADSAQPDEPEIIIDVLTPEMIENLANRSQGLQNLRRRRQTSCGKTGVLKINVYYDLSFKDLFQSSPIDRINSVLSHMQTFLSLSSLEIRLADGTVIDNLRLEIQDIQHLDQYYQATQDGLISFGSHLEDNGDASIHHNMLFSHDGHQYGVIGMAWTRTLCSSLKRYRSSIVEYFQNDVTTATTAVHELAHSLGATHDFNGKPSSPRYDSSDRSCTGIGGFMDYANNVDKWSTCSNEDFADYLSDSGICFELEDTCPTPQCSCSEYVGNKRKLQPCCKIGKEAGLCCDGCEC